MSKTIYKFRNIVITLLLVEFIIVIAASSLTNSHSLFGLSIYIFIKNTIMIGILYMICRQFDQEQVDISSVLGDDVGNACVFGGIGLIMYDENRNIMWVSELFKELGMDLTGQKLLEWQPSLEVLFEEEDVKVIETRHKKFEVFNNANSRVLYLRDVTEYVDLKEAYTSEQTILGYLSIDNYEDTIASVDEQKVSIIQSTIRNSISNWACDYGIVLRRYKSDGYILIFDEDIYNSLIRDKFNILETIKSEADKLGVVMTLSIGLARKYGSLKDLEEMASAALNLAHSRGGDQVVIKSENEQVRFFGGNSESSSKNNKVRARVIARTLRGLIKSSDRVLVMGHKQSDLDSFGASLGVYKIAKSYNVPANIILDFNSIEDKTARAANSIKKLEEYQNVIISPARAMDMIKPTTLLIVVDNHKPSLAIDTRVIDVVKNTVVIDHHRRSEEFILSPVLTYMEPTSSSTVELITELFDYQETSVKLNEEEATIMYAGMLVDTNNFKTRVGVRTFQSATKLKEQGVNITKAYEYLEDDFDNVMARINIMQNSYRYKNNILIAYNKENSKVSPALLAKVGNELLGTSGIEAVFTVGNITADKVQISARSSKNVNVQVIMESLGGGGHFSMAASQLVNCTVGEAISKLETKINEYLEERGE